MLADSPTMQRDTDEPRHTTAKALNAVTTYDGCWAVLHPTGGEALSRFNRLTLAVTCPAFSRVSDHPEQLSKAYGVQHSPATTSGHLPRVRAPQRRSCCYSAS